MCLAEQRFKTFLCFGGNMHDFHHIRCLTAHRHTGLYRSLTYRLYVKRQNAKGYELAYYEYVKCVPGTWGVLPQIPVKRTQSL